MTLFETAFGDDPGRWPLPTATNREELWLRAVAAGGQGHYGSALTDLATLSRGRSTDRHLSLAQSTRASFLRQLGWHTRARGWDGRALASAGGDGEASADALIGLAADALGVGRFSASAQALARAYDIVTDGRLRVRWLWVSAELAMVRGDGQAAVVHADEAARAAAPLGSARHAVKSEVVRAAARCSAGDLAGAREVADAALATTERLGMIPLRWALACLLADIGSTSYSAAEMDAIRDDAADTVRRRGGVWSVR